MKRAGTSADRTRARKLGEEERALWEQVTQAVRPLRPRRVVAAAPASGKIGPATYALSPRPAREPASPQPLEMMQRRQKQRLARGLEPIHGRLDLHGKTQAQAHTELLRFLRRGQTRGARFVLVITGKGAGAEQDCSERGVLKRQVPRWLSQPEFSTYVAGFEQAHARHGGAGALYVRLRRPRPAERI